MEPDATDEEVARVNKLVTLGVPSIPMHDVAKLLARLERVEGELRQTEKECENALAALAGEPYPYPEIKLRK